MSLFIDPDKPVANFPKLKGKAAEIKHFVAALAFAWECFMDADDVQHQMISLALQMSCDIDTILDRTHGQYVLKGDDLTKYQDAIWTFLSMQNALAVHYNRLPLALHLFDITIKSHYLAHSAFQAAWLHPTLGWCFSGEDLMQKMRGVTSQCCNGVPLQRTGLAVMEKYCVGMYFELSPSDKWWRVEA